jgi:tetratricopeptide (TPR) repeat protein
VTDQVQVWTEAYERESHDLLGLQAELGRAIAREIQLRLSPKRLASIARRHTQSPEAYDLYLRGRHYHDQMTHATMERALECFRQATELDPSYALAWAGIADSYSSRLFGADTRASEVAEAARMAAERALEHGSDVPEALIAAGSVQFLFHWDWAAAERHLRRAVELGRSNARGHWMLGHALSQQGRHEQAQAAASLARELEPLSPLSHSMSAQIAFSARNFEAAKRHAREALRAEPNDWVGYYQLGQACQQLGRIDEALEALEEATRLSRSNSKPISVAVYTLAACGRIDEARNAY